MHADAEARGAKRRGTPTRHADKAATGSPDWLMSELRCAGGTADVARIALNRWDSRRRAARRGAETMETWAGGDADGRADRS